SSNGNRSSCLDNLVIRLAFRATNTTVILRSSTRLRAERLEGWKQAPCLRPSFETAARKRERPPQDDGVVCCESATSTLRGEWVRECDLVHDPVGHGGAIDGFREPAVVRDFCQGMIYQVRTHYLDVLFAVRGGVWTHVV